MHDVVIIGGGISGLALAHDLGRRSPELSVLVLERGQRPGGTLRTIERDGFRAEAGPNGFLDRGTDTLDLVERLGLSEELTQASPAAKHRFIQSNGSLVPLPEGPGAFLKSPVLTPKGRARALLEPFIGPAEPGTEETLTQFVSRRLGAEVAQTLADAFVTGIFAGDPEQLSVDAAFPRLRALEQAHGSLVKGAAHIRKERKAQGATDTKGLPTGPTGALVSFRDGMGALPRALASALGPERVRTEADAETIERAADGRYRVRSPSVGVEAPVVVVSTPAPLAADLIDDLDIEGAHWLRGIPYAPVAVVALGFRREQVTHDLDGFGYLCPEREGRPILGCLFPSSIYPGLRAPPEHVLLRVLLGGIRHPERLVGGEDLIERIALDEIRGALGIEGAPVFREVVRYPRAIPQYVLGHRNRLADADARLSEIAPGVILHGNAYRGVGVNDCTTAALGTADRVLEQLGRQGS